MVKQWVNKKIEIEKEKRTYCNNGAERIVRGGDAWWKITCILSLEMRKSWSKFRKILLMISPRIFMILLINCMKTNLKAIAVSQCKLFFLPCYCYLYLSESDRTNCAKWSACLSCDKVSFGTKYIFACNCLVRKFNLINILIQRTFLQNMYYMCWRKTVITIIIMSKYMLPYISWKS